MTGTSYRLLITLLAFTAHAEADSFVRQEGSSLMLGDQPYRAIGVNIPHLSQAYLGTWFHCRQIYGTPEAMRAAMIEAVRDAQQHNVAFIRFFAWPGYPKGTAELYLRDQQAYWQQMDELFALCRTHGIKVVPSLGVLFKWNLDCGEPRTAIFDPNSRTHAATYGYVRQFVSRYRDDPTVLMWELENEAFLAADVTMEDRPAPARGVYPAESTSYREKFTVEDSLRFDQLAKLYREMAAVIRELDPHHLITSGDAGVRAESMSRRETYPDFLWRNDSLREHLSNLLASQPQSLDVFSLHAYGNFTEASRVDDLSHLDLLQAQIRAIHATRSPLFVGELGQLAPNLHEDPEAQWVRAALELLDHEGVALMALWAWHFPWHDKNHNISSGSSYPQLMQRVAEFNRLHAQLP